MNPTVFAVTFTGDSTATRVAESVAARGGRFVAIHSDRFPHDVFLTRRSGSGVTITTEDGTAHTLGPDDALWWRRVRLRAATDPALGDQVAQAAVAESRIVLRALALAHPGLVVDRPHHIHLAQDKALQLEIATSLGLDVLPTLVTNDPSAARAFWEAQGGEVITKMEHAFALETGDQIGLVHTSVVSEADLVDLDGLRACPMIFQRRVRTVREHRVTIVGERLFVGTLDYDKGAFGTDWRLAALHDPGAVNAAWSVGSLPASVASAVLRLADHLGLNYGAVDLLEDSDGRYWFLELNPSGEWGWMAAIGLDIADALAELLLGLAPARAPRLPLAPR